MPCEWAREKRGDKRGAFSHLGAIDTLQLQPLYVVVFSCSLPNYDLPFSDYDYARRLRITRRAKHKSSPVIVVLVHPEISLM